MCQDVGVKGVRMWCEDVGVKSVRMWVLCVNYGWTTDESIWGGGWRGGGGEGGTGGEGRRGGWDRWRGEEGRVGQVESG